MYAPATGIDGGVYVVTRERYALRIAGDNAERLFQPVGSDYSPVRYVSPIILDVELLIVAGRNGRLVGTDVVQSRTHGKARTAPCLPVLRLSWMVVFWLYEKMENCSPCLPRTVTC